MLCVRELRACVMLPRWAMLHTLDWVGQRARHRAVSPDSGPAYDLGFMNTIFYLAQGIYPVDKGMPAVITFAKAKAFVWQERKQDCFVMLGSLNFSSGKIRNSS